MKKLGPRKHKQTHPNKLLRDNRRVRLPGLRQCAANGLLPAGAVCGVGGDNVPRSKIDYFLEPNREYIGKSPVLRLLGKPRHERVGVGALPAVDVPRAHKHCRRAPLRELGLPLGKHLCNTLVHGIEPRALRLQCVGNGGVNAHTQKHVDCFLLRTVHKVVLDGPRHRLCGVHHNARRRALAGAHEIRLERGRPRIQLTEHVAVLHPHHLQRLVKTAVKLRRILSKEYAQLGLEQFEAKVCLDDVSAVEAVEAVCSENARLPLLDRSAVLHKVPVLRHVTLDPRPQQAVERVHASVFALRVKVKRHYVHAHALRLHKAHVTLKLIRQHLLPFLVAKEVHDHHGTVHFCLVVNVTAEGRDGGVKPASELHLVLPYLNAGLLPKDRDASTGLHKRCNNIVHTQRLLRFHKIRHIPVVVDAPSDESATRTLAAEARNECGFGLLVACIHRPQLDRSAHDRQYPRRRFNIVSHEIRLKISVPHEARVRLLTLSLCTETEVISVGKIKRSRVDKLAERVQLEVLFFLATAHASPVDIDRRPHGNKLGLTGAQNLKRVDLADGSALVDRGHIDLLSNAKDAPYSINIGKLGELAVALEVTQLVGS
eukprot:Opistho-2@12901